MESGILGALTLVIRASELVLVVDGCCQFAVTQPN